MHARMQLLLLTNRKMNITMYENTHTHINEYIYTYRRGLVQVVPVQPHQEWHRRLEDGVHARGHGRDVGALCII